MFSFKNDYSEGAHPKIMDALVNNNLNQEEGYGLDRHSQNAANRIKELIGSNNADVHLLSSGTQTNLIAISAMLRPHEACITASTGHIAVHEAGAIEATGHKLLAINTKDGKLTPDMIESVMAEHHFEHMVKPRLVYISNPTELGTIYTRKEIDELRQYCLSKNLLLYLDGARLGSALVVKEADLTLRDIYELTDLFFIGGTKTGALLGEALVVNNADLKEDFRYLIKQRGALMAKGRVMGIQFEELFRDNLYFELAHYANDEAQYMVKELKELGCQFLIDSPTNQIFPILKNTSIEVLASQFGFYTWATVDKQHSAIRLVTSWATPHEAVEEFVNSYKNLS